MVAPRQFLLVVQPDDPDPPSGRSASSGEGSRTGLGCEADSIVFLGLLLFAEMKAAGDAGRFKAFEAEGWTRKAASYECLTGLATARFIEPLLDAAGVGAGARVLDVACGPGRCAAAAAARGADVVGLDAAAGMVGLARARYPQIEFRQGDAEELPFPGDSFDAVVAGFVVNHLPAPERALAEFARVVRRKGRVALTVWDKPERMRLLGVLMEAVERAEGVEEPGLPAGGPDAFRFADDALLEQLLTAVGLEGSSMVSIGFEQRVGGTDELWEGLLGGSVRTAAVIERQPELVRRRVRAELERAVAPYWRGDGIVLPVAAKLASGRRP